MEESCFEFLERYQYSSEAFIYKGKLESNGIEVYVRDNNTVDANPFYSNAVGGVKLFVRRDQLSKAKAVLSEISRYSLDENNELVKCPKCGAEQVIMVTSIQDLKSLLAFLFSLLTVLLPFYSKHKYKCDSCNFEFDTP